MEGITKRLNQIRDHYRLSNRALAASLDEKPATTNNYMTGKREPTFGFIEKLLKTYGDISSEWLMRGEGGMFKEDKPTDESLMREVADMKMSLLVKEGIIKELKEVLVARNGGEIPNERKSLVG